MKKKSPRAPKKRRALTYAEQHNRSLKIYQNTASFLSWAGIMNFLGAVFALFNAQGSTFYYLNFAFNNWIFRSFEASGLALNNFVLFSVLILLIAASTGAIYILLGQLARRGYSTPLIIGTSVYLLDMVLLFFIPPYLEGPNYIQIAFIFHALLLAMMIVSVIFYFHILHLEKVERENKTAENNVSHEQ